MSKPRAFVANQASLVRSVSIEIECIDLPPHDWGGHSEIWLGIQRGKDVIQEVKLPADRITFEAELRVGGNPAESNPNFLGPFSHGKVQERFLYLCWGQPYGGHWVGFRRIKLPLVSLTWKDLESGQLKATLRGTDAKGGPVCATVGNSHLTWSARKEG